MFPKINPKQMEKMMKKMGMKSEQIEADEVIIRSSGKEIKIKNPQVQKIGMMGQESFQISGDIEETASEGFTDDDVQFVMDQTECTEEDARAMIKETGDIAEAILKLQKTG